MGVLQKIKDSFGKEVIKSNLEMKHKKKLVDEILNELNEKDEVLSKTEWERIVARNVIGGKIATI